MKKLTIILLSIFLSFCCIYAQNTNDVSIQKDESKWTDLSYENVPILKILDSRDAYIVIYQKNKIGTGTTVIPKKWANGNPENPRKLKFRKIKHPKESFMTIVKKGGEFKRVILTVPMSKKNSMWGIVDNSVKIEGLDKENMDDLVL